MLHIILLILKIIGIVLLSILGLLLFGVICILFVPIRYKGAGTWYQEKHGKVVVSWLLHIISIHITYDNGESDIKYKLFGIRLKRRKKNKKKNAKKAIQEELEEKPEKNTQEGNQEKPENTSITLTENVEKTTPQPVKKDEKTTKAKKKWNLFGIIRKIRFKIRTFCDKIKRINEKKNHILDFIREEDTKVAWKLAKSELIKLIKYILPTKFKLYMKFGFEDPANTGKLLGIIYMFYGYTKNFQIYPNFQNKIFEGETSFKGRIRVSRLLYVFFKLWRNDQIKNTISRAKQI